MKSLGDGLMLTFGSPRQAVGFALATQRALAASAPRVRIGINTGEVIDTSTDPIGGAVNAAARIAGRAAGGEVLVSDVVRQLVGIAPAVAFVDRGRHRLKGFADRLASLAGDRLPRRAGRRGTVGRSTSWSPCRAFVSSLVAGAGGAVALEGEAGIGKTHLVREVAAMARAAGVQVVEVVADEVTRRAGFVPHGLIEERRIPAVSGIGSANCCIGRPVTVIPATSASRSSRPASTRSSRWRASDAALLIVEDAHWADDLSVAVLRSLILAHASRGSVWSCRCDRHRAPRRWTG